MESLPGLWLLGAAVVALVASREFGRSALGWFVLAVVLSPAVGALLFVLPPRRVPCASCAELIKPSAVVCRFCGRPRPPDSTPARGAPLRAVLGLLLVVALLLALGRCETDVVWWQSGGSLKVP